MRVVCLLTCCFKRSPCARGFLPLGCRRQPEALGRGLSTWKAFSTNRGYLPSQRDRRERPEIISLDWRDAAARSPPLPRLRGAPHAGPVSRVRVRGVLVRDAVAAGRRAAIARPQAGSGGASVRPG